MRKRWAVLPAALAVAVSAVPGPVAALNYTWSWSNPYTDVAEANREFKHRQPSAGTGQKAAHQLSAGRNRGDDSRGRAAAAAKTRFEPVLADRIRVTFFGRSAESDNDPVARLKVYVHCVGELESEWVLVGAKDVDPSASSQTLSRSITTEDCETQTEDGVMVQVVTGERGDRRVRTVFLERAELGPQGAPVWIEDFTVP